MRDSYRKTMVFGSTPMLFDLREMCCDVSAGNPWQVTAKSHQVVVLGFSLVNRESFENAKTFWMHEIQTKTPLSPIVLIGFQSDLRDEGQFKDDDPNNSVSQVEATQFAEQLGCEFAQVSAKTRQGLNEMFAAITRAFCKSILSKHQNLNSTSSKFCIIFLL